MLAYLHLSKTRAAHVQPAIYISKQSTRVSQKVKGLSKKPIYCKHTETKLILLFNVIPLNFNAPFQHFTSFLIPSEKKFFGCILTTFEQCQFLE
jgi:hypothetical protein